MRGSRVGIQRIRLGVWGIRWECGECGEFGEWGGNPGNEGGMREIGMGMRRIGVGMHLLFKFIFC